MNKDLFRKGFWFYLIISACAKMFSEDNLLKPWHTHDGQKQRKK